METDFTPPPLQKEVSFRPFTQDLQILFEVLEHNKYGVEDFDQDYPVVDIGAHIGAFALCCLHKGAKKVVCYEAEQDNLEMLCDNLAPWSHHVDIYQGAVAARTGTAKLQLISADRTGSAHILSGKGRTIDCLSINDVLLKHPVIKLLKLSVNGAEKQILDAAFSMNGVETICGEVHYQMGGSGAAKPTDQWLAKRLLQLGFKRNFIRHDRHQPTTRALFSGKRK